MRTFSVLALVLSLAVPGLSQCGSCGSKPVSAKKAAPKTIVETAAAAGQFKTLLAAAKAAGLAGVLNDGGPFTVFAPTDDAFAKLPDGTVAGLLKPENKAKLVAILKYHVVSGTVPAKAVVGLKHATTLNGQRVDIAVSEGGVRVSGAKVVKTDIKCSNGMIHVIDSVILPETSSLVGVASKAKTFQTLLAAAKAAGLASVLDRGGPFTVFAPTDAAFAKLPEGTVANLLKPENKGRLASILKHHVVSGRVFSDQAIKAAKAKTLLGTELTIRAQDDGVRVGAAKVVAADVQAGNGVIHVVDTVLLP